jgi:hypothetical protein
MDESNSMLLRLPEDSSHSKGGVYMERWVMGYGMFDGDKDAPELSEGCAASKSYDLRIPPLLQVLCPDFVLGMPRVALISQLTARSLKVLTGERSVMDCTNGPLEAGSTTARRMSSH